MNLNHNIVDVRYFGLARDHKFCSKYRKCELSSIRNSGRLLCINLSRFIEVDSVVDFVIKPKNTNTNTKNKTTHDVNLVLDLLNRTESREIFMTLIQHTYFAELK